MRRTVHRERERNAGNDGVEGGAVAGKARRYPPYVMDLPYVMTSSLPCRARQVPGLHAAARQPRRTDALRTLFIQAPHLLQLILE